MNPFTRTLNDASLRKLIVETYQSSIASLANADLLSALKSNERMPLFIANLEKEFKRLPRKFQTKDHVVYAVREFTKTFVKNVETKAQQMAMSDAEKSRIETTHHKAQILDRAATTGIIDEEVASVLNEEA